MTCYKIVVVWRFRTKNLCYDIVWRCKQAIEHRPTRCIKTNNQNDSSNIRYAQVTNVCVWKHIDVDFLLPMQNIESLSSLRLGLHYLA